MALKESIDKELNSINEKIKFYRNVLFALWSGLVWLIYNSIGAKLVYMLFAGIMLVIGVIIRLKFLETKERTLIEKLKDL